MEAVPRSFMARELVNVWKGTSSLGSMRTIYGSVCVCARACVCVCVCVCLRVWKDGWVLLYKHTHTHSHTHTHTHTHTQTHTEPNSIISKIGVLLKFWLIVAPGWIHMALLDYNPKVVVA